jgi:hypothetical protein
MSIDDLAATVGCHGFRPGGHELYVAASGDCHGVPGIDQVVTFNNNDARDGWLKFAHYFGHLCDAGDRWVVCGSSEAAIKQVQGHLGGDIRS